MHDSVTLRALLGPHHRRRRPAVRTRQLSGPSCLGFVLRLAQESVEVSGGLAQARSSVGNASCLP
jgi:hypothetical protein